MILESEQEKIAFAFIADIVGDAFSKNGCNDLDKEVLDKFKGITIPVENSGPEPLKYDFDVLLWLSLRIRNKLFSDAVKIVPSQGHCPHCFKSEDDNLICVNELLTELGINDEQ